MTALLRRIIVLGCAGLLPAAACTEPPQPQPPERTLAQARQIALELFEQLDGFELVKQREVGLAGRPAVRMEARWQHEGQPRRGIIYVVDHPALFNVIHYTAPQEEQMYRAGYPVFEQMMKHLRVIQHTGALEVVDDGEHRRMLSPELQLEIRFPADWVYAFDEVNRALVFSGPRDRPSWMSTISFSVIHKWAGQQG
jgi:hypothetical protein